MTLNVEKVSEALNTAYAKLDEAKSAYMDEASTLTASIDKLSKWLWANAPHTADSVIEEYVAVRDARAEIKKEYDDADARLKLELERRETWLLSAIDSVGVEALRGEHGTAFIQVKRRSSCGDWPTFWQYLADNKRFDLLEKRVSQAPIAKMIEEGEDLPPGINIHSERTVTVRRS